MLVQCALLLWLVQSGHTTRSWSWRQWSILYWRLDASTAASSAARCSATLRAERPAGISSPGRPDPDVVRSIFAVFKYGPARKSAAGWSSGAFPPLAPVPELPLSGSPRRRPSPCIGACSGSDGGSASTGDGSGDGSGESRGLPCLGLRLCGGANTRSLASATFRGTRCRRIASEKRCAVAGVAGALPSFGNGAEPTIAAASPFSGVWPTPRGEVGVRTELEWLPLPDPELVERDISREVAPRHQVRGPEAFRGLKEEATRGLCPVPALLTGLLGSGAAHARIASASRTRGDMLRSAEPIAATSPGSTPSGPPTGDASIGGSGGALFECARRCAGMRIGRPARSAASAEELLELLREAAVDGGGGGGMDPGVDPPAQPARGMEKESPPREEARELAEDGARALRGPPTPRVPEGSAPSGSVEARARGLEKEGVFWCAPRKLRSAATDAPLGPLGGEACMRQAGRGAAPRAPSSGSAIGSRSLPEGAGDESSLSEPVPAPAAESASSSKIPAVDGAVPALAASSATESESVASLVCELEPESVRVGIRRVRPVSSGIPWLGTVTIRAR